MLESASTQNDVQGNVSHLLTDHVFILAFILQSFHDILGRDENLGVLLQQLREVLEE
jgi:hypothetical protein